MGTAIGDIVEAGEIDFKDLKGKVVAVDAYNIIYQFLSSIRQRDGTPLKDSKGRITSHLSGILYRNSNLIQEGIKLVYVFDGKPDIMKEGTLEKRKERKEKAESEYEKALKKGEMEKARTKAQQTSRMSEEIENSSKELLELLGIPWIQAPAEGENQAAHLVRNGDAWAVGSQDFDSLLAGAERLVRNLTVSGKRKLPGKNEYKEIKPELIVLQDVLDKLEISREQLIDIALLCGTDYNHGVKGIGPKRGLKYVKKYGRIEEVLDEKEETINNLNDIKTLFLEPKVTDDYDIKFKDPNIDEVKTFLCDKHGFSESRVDKALEKVIDGRNMEKQTSLTSF
ncbi:MAG: flap endonuclease-1 [Candidatus Saliniplasma sp.]